MEIVLHGLDQIVCAEFHKRALDQMLHNIISFESIINGREIDLVMSFYGDEISEDLTDFCKENSVPLLLIRPWSSDICDPFNSEDFSNATITIRDLLIPSNPYGWGPLDVKKWLKSLKNGE